MKRTEPKQRVGNRDINRLAQYFVARELCGQGYAIKSLNDSNNFTNIVAADGNGRDIALLVRARTKGDWQFDAEEFLDIEMQQRGKTWQSVRGMKPLPTGIRVVLVTLGNTNQFHILGIDELQQRLQMGYTKYLEKKKGFKPGPHTRIKKDDLTFPANNWDALR